MCLLCVRFSRHSEAQPENLTLILNRARLKALAARALDKTNAPQISLVNGKKRSSTPPKLGDLPSKRGGLPYEGIVCNI